MSYKRPPHYTPAAETPAALSAAPLPEPRERRSAAGFLIVNCMSCETHFEQLQAEVLCPECQRWKRMFGR